MSEVFVFGSNREGRHGKGAALEARTKWGARYGVAMGRQGNSYAIPTKELRAGKPVVTLSEIESYVRIFLVHAAEHPDDFFHVTKIGCGLAGFKEWQISPMFKGAPPNVKLPDGWEG